MSIKRDVFANQRNQRLLLSNNKFKFQKIIGANDNIDILIGDVSDAWNELCIKKYDIEYFNFNLNARHLLNDNYIPTKIKEWKETFDYYNNLPKSICYIAHNKKQTYRLKNTYNSIRIEKKAIADTLSHMTYFKAMYDNDNETRYLIDCVAVPIKYLIDWNNLLLSDSKLYKPISLTSGSKYIKLYNHLQNLITDSYDSIIYSTTTTHNTTSTDYTLASRLSNRYNWTKRRIYEIKANFNSLKQLREWCLPESFNCVRMTSKLPNDIFNIVISYFEYNPPNQIQFW